MKINNYSSLQFNNPPLGISQDTYNNFEKQCQGVAAQLTAGYIQAASDLTMSIKYQVSALNDSGAITQDQNGKLQQMLNSVLTDISKDDRGSFSGDIRSFTNALYDLVNH